MAHDLGYQKGAIALRCRVQLAVIKIMRGKYTEAKKDLDKIDEECGQWLGSKDRPTSAEISYHRAVALVRNGDFKDAIARLNSPMQESEDEPLLVNRNRLLGLAYAYLGNFSQASCYIEKARAMMVEKKDGRLSKATAPRATLDVGSNKEPGIRPPPLSGLEAAVRLSESQILLMRGRANEGLTLVERLSGDLEKAPDFGVSHLLTLETRFIWCRLLTEAGRLGQAKAKCVETIDLTTKYLERDHPLILKATSALVAVQRLDACPSEALANSKNLVCRTSEFLGTENRQTLRYGFQTASLSLWMGNHVDALEKLRKAHLASRGRWDDEHPWTISCAIEYAVALSLSGRSGESKKKLEDVLLYQSRSFDINMDSCECDNSMQDLLDHLTTVSRKPKDSADIHPSLLNALGAWARNELTRSGAKGNQAVQAQYAIFQIRKGSPSFEPGHYATMQAGLDLANTLRASSDPERSEKAESLYKEVDL
ncbi:uncharacterized protein PG998_006497 [Apiospora kogelbergensis]